LRKFASLVTTETLVDHLEGSSRNVLLGISNSVMLAEITANRKSHHLHYATPGTASVCDL